MFFPCRAAILLALAATMPAAHAQQGRPSGAPLRAQLVEARQTPLERTVSALGTLRANESVDLVPELSRRVVAITVEEGSSVSQGDLLFRLDDGDLLASLAEIRAKVALAEANEARAQRLYPDNAISLQELEAAGAELEILRAQLKSAEVELEKTRITAPFDGVVGVRRVSPGAYVQPGNVLATLQDVSRLKVEFTLPERYAPEVRTGLEFTFRVSGSGDDHPGVVDVVEPGLDEATRSVRLRGISPAAAGLLPGGFAEITLVLDGAVQGHRIPAQALVPSPRGEAVYVIKNGKAEMVPVEVGIRTESDVQILRGLDEGDLIAITNLMRIRPGVEVVAEQDPGKP